MSAWVLILAIASAAIGGCALGVLATIRFTRWREKMWLRHRCRDAAKWLQVWFGNPLLLRRMVQRIDDGHDFTADRPWRLSLQDKLEREFRVGGTA